MARKRNPVEGKQRIGATLLTQKFKQKYGYRNISHNDMHRLIRRLFILISELHTEGNTINIQGCYEFYPQFKRGRKITNGFLKNYDLPDRYVPSVYVSKKVKKKMYEEFIDEEKRVEDVKKALKEKKLEYDNKLIDEIDKFL